MLCIQVSNHENTDTAFQKKDYKAQEPKFKRLKTRKNLRTTGFNLYNSFICYKGKRSVHSTLCLKEGTQANKLFLNSCQPFVTKIHSKNLNEQVMVAELKQLVKKCKNKNGRYKNLIQIISSFSTIQLAYLKIKRHIKIFAKKVDKTILDSVGFNI